MKLSNYFWEPIKIEHANVWFWSDLHIGHKCEHWETPLWKNRGFNSVEEHDETLIKRWNDKLNEESEVFSLGDILFGSHGEERLNSLFNQLTFNTLYVLPGNHHAGYKQLLNQSLTKDGIRYSYFGDKKVYFVPNYLEIIVCGQPIVLSHYPLASWNGQAKGSIMVHGHCHQNLYKSEIGKLLYNCKIVDVGIENLPTPLSYTQLRSKFKTKENITFDHHTKDTRNPF